MLANAGDCFIALLDFISVLTDAVDDVRTLSTAVDGISKNAILNARFFRPPPPPAYEFSMGCLYCYGHSENAT